LNAPTEAVWRSRDEDLSGARGDFLSNGPAFDLA
jgi:hypothetical protein